MMEAIALWHREGVSSSSSGSVRCRTFVAKDEVGVLSRCEPGRKVLGMWGVCVVVWYVIFGLPSSAAL